MALSDIRTALSTHLSAVTKLQQVSLGRNAAPSGGFPFCRFYLSGLQDALADQQQNEDGWRFSIDIIQEINVKNVDAAEADFQDAIEEVKHKLNTEWLLRNGSNVPTVQFSMIDMSQ